MENIQKRHP